MVGIYGCLCLLLVVGPWTAGEARRAITWPPKRARESVLWPAPPAAYSIDDATDEDDEPSCDELRAIWRLSKRAAQRSLLTNEIPLRSPPLPSSSGRGQYYGYVVRSPQLSRVNDGHPRQSFGRIIVDPSDSYPPPMTAAYGNGYDRVAEELRKGIFADKPFTRLGVKNSPVYGHVAYPTTPSSSVALQQKQQQQQQPSLYKTRALYKPYTVAKSTSPSKNKDIQKYYNKNLNNKDNNDNNNNQWGSYMEPRPGKVLHKPPVYGRYDSSPSFNGFSTDKSACEDIAYKRCKLDEDCECYGFYQCAKGKCRPSKKLQKPKQGQGKWEDKFGTWHERPLLPSELGASPVTAKGGRPNWPFVHDRKKVFPPPQYTNDVDRFDPWS